MPAAKGFNMIYYVEDDDNIRDLTVYALRKQGIEAEGFSCDGEFKAAVARRVPDAVLLDIMLPDTDGLAIMRRLRADRLTATVPIMMLTAKDTELDKVMALDGGADDYLTKPFRVAELRARVAAHLRRQNRTPSHKITRGGVTLDLSAKEACVGSTPLHLTKSEYAICELLALHAGQTFSKEQIYEAVFGYDGTADDTAITQHIKNIRAKLRVAGAGEVLQTIWGVGYQWKNES